MKAAILTGVDTTPIMYYSLTQVGAPIPAAILKRKADDLCVIGQHSFHMCGVEAGIAYFCYLYHVVLSSLLLSLTPHSGCLKEKRFSTLPALHTVLSITNHLSSL